MDINHRKHITHSYPKHRLGRLVLGNCFRMKWLLSWYCHLTGEAVLKGFRRCDNWKPAPSQPLLSISCAPGSGPWLPATFIWFPGEQFKWWDGLWEMKKNWNFSQFFSGKTIDLAWYPSFQLGKIKMVYVSPLESAWSLESLRGGGVAAQKWKMQFVTVLTKGSRGTSLWNSAISAYLGAGRVQDSNYDEGRKQTSMKHVAMCWAWY